jgi:hypothetical protein
LPRLEKSIRRGSARRWKRFGPTIPCRGELSPGDLPDQKEAIGLRRQPMGKPLSASMKVKDPHARSKASNSFLPSVQGPDVAASEVRRLWACLPAIPHSLSHPHVRPLHRRSRDRVGTCNSYYSTEPYFEPGIDVLISRSPGGSAPQKKVNRGSCVDERDLVLVFERGTMYFGL